MPGSAVISRIRAEYPETVERDNDLACSVCKAPAGNPCRSAVGNVTRTHVDRLVATVRMILAERKAKAS